MQEKDERDNPKSFSYQTNENTAQLDDVSIGDRIETAFAKCLGCVFISLSCVQSSYCQSFYSKCFNFKIFFSNKSESIPIFPIQV